jgi:hypothetical protein
LARNQGLLLAATGFRPFPQAATLLRAANLHRQLVKEVGRPLARGRIHKT